MSKVVAVFLVLGMAACDSAPTVRTAYIEVKGMVQQLGIT